MQPQANQSAADTAAPGSPFLSVVIIAQDDAERIGHAIQSCRPFADEIVVVDGGSKDNTVQVARSLGCRVLENPWPGYAKQRMFGTERAAYDWVFLIDTDETVNDELAAELLALKLSGGLTDATIGFSLYRIGDFLGRFLDRGEHLVRLYNRRAYAIRDSLVHEVPDIPEDKVRKLDGILWHYGFRSITDHANRFNKYTGLEAEIMTASGKPFSILRLIVRPPVRFLQQYFLRGMFKKGVAGFAVAVFWAYYDFLVSFKHYERTRAQARMAAHKQPKSSVKEDTRYAVQYQTEHLGNRS